MKTVDDVKHDLIVLTQSSHAVHFPKTLSTWIELFPFVNTGSQLSFSPQQMLSAEERISTNGRATFYALNFSLDGNAVSADLILG